ncbi:hypothetical protein KAR91_18295 [Candidatus Pacearchaeota archaeon]|nr:hypothetical protein [Candidatus Pacearchaeota archaeon]
MTGTNDEEINKAMRELTYFMCVKVGKKEYNKNSLLREMYLNHKCLFNPILRKASCTEVRTFNCLEIVLDIPLLTVARDCLLICDHNIIKHPSLKPTNTPMMTGGVCSPRAVENKIIRSRIIDATKDAITIFPDKTIIGTEQLINKIVFEEISGQNQVKIRYLIDERNLSEEINYRINKSLGEITGIESMFASYSKYSPISLCYRTSFTLY